MLNIGMIGLDTSHCTAFTRLLNDPDHPYHISGGKVTVAFPGGSPDMERSRSRVGPITEEMEREFGVRIVSSCEEVAEASDALFLTSVDGRVHLEQFRRIAPFRKPIFIDKPLAVTSRDADAIAALSREHRVPVMSASSLRYAESWVRGVSEAGRDGIIGVDCFGPMPLEPTQPGLFWYGIHGVEMLYAALGPGCVQVTVVAQADHDVVVGRWADGRLGTFRGNRRGNPAFGGVIHRREGSRFVDATAGEKPVYAGLLERVMELFTTGVPPLDLRETLEVIGFIEAANASRETGSPVSPARAAEEAKSGPRGEGR